MLGVFQLLGELGKLAEDGLEAVELCSRQEGHGDIIEDAIGQGDLRHIDLLLSLTNVHVDLCQIQVEHRIIPGFPGFISLL